MSWQDLVKNNLLGTGHVSKAAICGHDGSIWGKSDNFAISPAEALAAGRGFDQKDALLGTGLRFEGEKYFVLQADEERIIGKKASSGFFIYKTGQELFALNKKFRVVISHFLAVIISIYEGGVQPEMCSKTTGDLADYFKTINY